MTIRIDVLDAPGCQLGEGPVWDHEQGALWWVDSHAPRLFRLDYASGRLDAWTLPGRSLGSLGLCRDQQLVLAMDQGFYFFSPGTGQVEPIALPLAGREHLRLNDGKVDPFGGFVSGGMNIDYREHENCSMYRLSPALEVSEILDGFDCFNGPCFSADGASLFVTGRRDGVIERFDYGPTQTPRNGRALLENGNPDGATVDDEGCIWSAQWDDACVIRVTPDGEIERRVEVPGQIVSSVMFGGPGLDLLFVTTVGESVHGARPQGPDAGRTLAISGIGVRGRAEPRFAA